MPTPGELWLSLDLSAPTGSICLHAHRRGRVKLRAELLLNDAGKHSESVLTGIATVLEQAGVGLESVNRFLTPTGPGSFTGLRVAFSALKAFAMAGGQPIELLDGHEVLALRHLMQTAPNRPAEIAVATRVTRESLLVSRFRTDGRAGVDRMAEKLEAEAGDAVLLPMQARYLAETLALIKSRRTLVTPEEIAAASPQYFGSRFD